MSPVHKVLGWCAVKGRYLLITGLIIALVFPGLTVVLKPFIAHMMMAMLFFAAFRVGFRAAIGAMADGTRFHDGLAGGAGFRFAGVIDEVAVYGKVLSASAIDVHHVAGTGDAGTPPAVAISQPVADEVVSGTVTVVLAASDNEDPVGDLVAEVSVDGGASWIPAPYSPGDGDHRVGIDTTVLAEGPLTIDARVTDSNGLVAASSVSVEVDNIAPGYVDIVLADGPDAYWRLGESSGTVATELVNGINGTYTGGVTLGWAGLVAGTDTAANFANNSLISASSPSRRA